MRRSLHHIVTPIVFSLLLIALLFTVLWDRIIVRVPAGSAGVRWQLLFGGTTLTHAPLKEGLNLKLPWDRIFIYDMRLRTHTELYDVVSKEGLQVSIRMHYRWRLFPGSLSALAKNIGPDYLTKMLVPEIGSMLSDVCARYSYEEIYSTQRQNIQTKVVQGVTSDKTNNGIGAENSGTVGDNVIGLVDVLIREVVLPPSLHDAIESKLRAAQLVQEYEFRLEREKLEASRKEIEASGIRRFQETVTPGMSDSYLKWRGIEATQQLATSPNSKIIVMGNGDRGLPVLLNAADDPTASRARDDAARKASIDTAVPSMGTGKPAVPMPRTGNQVRPE